jgi:outer membrane receptor protein involved in Fe transport
MNRNSEVTLAVRRALVMGAAATTGLTTLPAHAQDQDQSAAPEQTVTVTGTRIRRVDQETASPVFVMDSAAIQQSGVATMGELLQRVPAVAGAATNPQVNNGGGTGESNIELRGLGAQRTLVLLNGRRINLLGNTTTSAVDINMIPINAIERVEVLKEGAGAVYGSDAIAGVVNFITRKDVDGAEASVEYGETGQNDGKHTNAGLLFGSNTDKMHWMAAANYNKQDAVSAADRDFAKFAQYLYSGSVIQAGSGRNPNGRISVAGIDANGDPCATITHIAGQVSGTNGRTTTADYRCYAGATDSFNYQPFNLLITPQERGSLFTNLNYDVNDSLSAYAEVLYTHTSSGFVIAPLPFDATQDDTVISANSYYNPFGIDFGGVGGKNPNLLNRFVSLGNRHSSVTTQDALANAGLKGKIADTGWEWDANIGYSHKDQDQDIGGYLLKDKFTQALGPSFLDTDGVVKCGTDASNIISGCTPINVFNLTDPAQIAALNAISTNYTTSYVYRTKTASLNLNGKIFELPAGDVQLAVGAEYRDQEGEFNVDALSRGTPPLFLSCLLAQETCSGDSSAKYNVKEYYAEIFAPLLKDLPGVHALNLNAGIRQSNYSKSTIGKSTNAEFKVEYRPISDILVRGSYAEVFRAPTIADLSFAPTQDSPTFTDPCLGLTSAMVAANPNLNKACAGVPVDTGYSGTGLSQITGLITGSQDLKPETGDVTTFGVVYDSSLIRGLSLNLDYWKYKLDNLIIQLDPNYAINQCAATGDDTFCGLVFRFTDPVTVAPENLGNIQVFKEPITNIGKLKTDGFDFGVKYALRQTAIGSFNFSIDVTRINSYENTPAPGAAPVEIAGTFDRQFGNYAKWRGLAGVGWQYAGFDGLVTARYVGKLQVNDPDGAPGIQPPLDVSQITYIDLTLGYNFPTNTRVQLGATNLTDRQPPILYQNNVLNANTDVSTYDTLGRRWFVGVTQKF